MRKIIIGVDVDDVTANLVDAWLHVYNFEYNDCVEQKDIKSWAINNYVKCGQNIYKYLKEPDLYNIVKPIDDAIIGIEALNAMNFRIVFITASTPEQAGRKYKWLCDYGLIENRKDYIESLDKSLVKTDYLIDDNPENVVSALGQGIIFTKEWNKSLIGYPRVNNWTEIIKYFVNVANTREITGV